MPDHEHDESEHDDSPSRNIPNWEEREIARLAKNQLDFRNELNRVTLANTVAISDQTRELTERITSSQRETAREISDAIKHVELAVEKRVDKLEIDLRGNATAVGEIKVELTTIKVRVAMWCAIGAMLASVLSAVITAVIIRAVTH
jgi:hypothetical protein